MKSESAVAIKKRIDDAHANQTLEEIQPHGGLARWLPDGLSSLTNLDEKLPISRNAVQDLARLFPQREPFLSGVHLPSAAKLTPLDQTEDSRRVLGQICPECLAALERLITCETWVLCRSAGQSKLLTGWLKFGERASSLSRRFWDVHVLMERSCTYSIRKTSNPRALFL